jgi:two-component system response regulator YesN
MFKVLLVDDEEEVRHGIRDRINWASFGFEIAGEAENGREAMNFFDDCLPDVVVTDINMPFMDGIELAAEINAMYPTVKVVILTGFDDFKFAQAAIKYGVSDYILKPVLPKDINELLEKLRDRINSEKEERENIEKLRRHYNDSLPLLRENFLVNLILGKPISGKTETRIRDMNIKLKGNWFSAAICKIDSESIVNDKLSDRDIELKRFAVFNIINELIESRKTGEAFIHDDGIVIILGIDCMDRTAARNKMLSVLEAIRQSVCKFLSITVSIGLGKITASTDGIRESYLSSLTARDYKLILSGNKVIFVEDLEPGISSFFHLESEKEENLISSIKFKGEDDIAEAVNDLFKELGESGASLREYQLYFVEIISSLMKLTRLFKIESSQVLPEDSGIHIELDKFNSIEEAKDWIYKLSINISNGIAGKRSDASEVLFEKATHYINDNYGDPELNVQKISNYLYISPSYLGLIFKKKSGTTFLKYLVGVRLERAKELLMDMNKKIAGVAEEVGYPDVSYFSYFFKKNAGLSPREFRKKAAGESE